MDKFFVLYLGNHDCGLDNTIHNLGRIMAKYSLNALENDCLEIEFSEDQFSCCYNFTLQNKNFQYIFLKTFMNISGEVLIKMNSDIVEYLRKHPERFLVVADDVKTRKVAFMSHEVKYSRGHNGLRSLNKHFESFWLLNLCHRFDRKLHGSLVDFVVSEVPSDVHDRLKKIALVFNKALPAIENSWEEIQELLSFDAGDCNMKINF